MATVELLDIVEEGQTEGLLVMEADRRNKKHSYSDTEKVARIEHKNGNSYVRKEVWKMAMKHYNTGIKLLHEVTGEPGQQGGEEAEGPSRAITERCPLLPEGPLA